MPAPLSFTLDVEHHAPGGAPDPRVGPATRHVLDLFDDLAVRATVFVVGDVAEHEPALVTEIAQRGHEVALHGWRHTPLPDVGRDRFVEEAARGRELLSTLTGTEIVGFRAPTFSLTPASVWAVDALAELGFVYSSSVLPAPNPLYGFPGAPATPFRWRSGLVEFPSPVVGWGPLRIPYLGGTYLRLLPVPLVLGCRRLGRDGSAPWAYAHPYDFDADEPFWREPVAGRLARLLWVGRRGMAAKLQRLAAGGVAPPLAEQVAVLGERLDIFTPPVPLVGARGRS